MAEGNATVPSLPDELWQRRPVRALLVDILGTLGAGALLVAAMLRSEIEDWVKGEQLEVRFLTVAAGLVLGGALLIAVGRVLRWRRFRYAVTDDGLHLRQGGLSLTVSSYAARKIGGVDISEPWLQRLAGLATLTAQVSGSGDSQAEISGIPRAEAHRLQSLLLATRDAAVGAVAEQTAEPAATDPTTDARPDGEPAGAVAAPRRHEPVLVLDAVRARALVVRSPQLWFTASATTLLLVLCVILLVTEGWRSAIGAGIAVGIAAGATARTAVERWRSVATWEIRSRGGDLVVSRGRLNRSSTTIRAGKVSAVVLAQGPILRRSGWWTVDVAISAFGASVTGDENKATICAAATSQEVDRLLTYLLPSAEPGTLTQVAAAMGEASPPASWVRSRPQARWFAPLAWRHQGLTVAGRHLLVRSGRWSRSLRLIDRHRIQLTEVVSGPVDRHLGMASLIVHMTPGPTRRTAMPQLHAATARSLRGELPVDASRSPVG